MDWGHEDLVPPVPNTFRTAVATTGNDIIGVPFMTINPGVTEMGPRQFNSLHIANYYKQLSVIGEWQFGSQNYAFNTSREFQRVIPVQSWYVQAGYFLTGETVSARGAVAPYRPFDLRKGKFGMGAWEAQARYSYLDISQSIFSSGLSDPNLYTNELYTYDVGFNWYLTQYVKFSFEYERAQFDNPTLFRTLPDGTALRQCHSDMFLMRTQIFF
jgi:phosphate-selective porin OprO/OprP